MGLFFKNKKAELRGKLKTIAESKKKKALFRLNPQSSLLRLEIELTEVKRENESVSIDNFKKLYSFIHQTNHEIR